MMLLLKSGRRYQLSFLFGQGEPVTIGRGTGNSISLGNLNGLANVEEKNLLLLSRKHAQLSVRDGQLQIMDCNSVNGTWVNDCRLAQDSWKVLHDKDLVSLGG